MRLLKNLAKLFEFDRIKYIINDRVETGIAIDTQQKGYYDAFGNYVGGTFDIEVVCNQDIPAKIYHKIPEILDELDHSTISDNPAISEINTRCFYIDTSKIDESCRIASVIFARTLISFFQYYEVEQYIDSIKVSLGKESVVYTDMLMPDCIYSFSIEEDKSEG